MRRRRLHTLLVLAAVAVTLLLGAKEPAPLHGYRVIVHPQNAVVSLERSFVQDAFLKKVRYWPGGNVIRPADLTPKATARGDFSREVLGRSVQAVRAYWRQRIFSGRDVPPPEFDSDEAAIAYVLKHPTAIAYVSAATPLGGTKPVAVRK